MSKINPAHNFYGADIVRGKQVHKGISIPEQYANTPVFDPAIIPAGRSVHIGGGVFMQRCTEESCPLYVLTWGGAPYLYEWHEHRDSHIERPELPPVEIPHPIYRDAVVRYVDGSPVLPGDRVTYQQAGGGLLPPGPPRTGTAVITPEAYRTCPEDAHVVILERDDAPGRYCNLNGHVIHRAA